MTLTYIPKNTITDTIIATPTGPCTSVMPSPSPALQLGEGVYRKSCGTTVTDVVNCPFICPMVSSLYVETNSVLLLTSSFQGHFILPGLEEYGSCSPNQRSDGPLACRACALPCAASVTRTASATLTKSHPATTTKSVIESSTLSCTTLPQGSPIPTLPVVIANNTAGNVTIRQECPTSTDPGCPYLCDLPAPIVAIINLEGYRVCSDLSNGLNCTTCAPACNGPFPPTPTSTCLPHDPAIATPPAITGPPGVDNIFRNRCPTNPAEYKNCSALCAFGFPIQLPPNLPNDYLLCSTFFDPFSIRQRCLKCLEPCGNSSTLPVTTTTKPTGLSVTTTGWGSRSVIVPSPHSSPYWANTSTHAKETIHPTSGPIKGRSIISTPALDTTTNPQPISRGCVGIASPNFNVFCHACPTEPEMVDYCKYLCRLVDANGFGPSVCQPSDITGSTIPGIPGFQIASCTLCKASSLTYTTASSCTAIPTFSPVPAVRNTTDGHLYRTACGSTVEEVAQCPFVCNRLVQTLQQCSDHNISDLFGLLPSSIGPRPFECQQCLPPCQDGRPYDCVPPVPGAAACPATYDSQAMISFPTFDPQARPPLFLTRGACGLTLEDSVVCPFLCQQFLPNATTGELLPQKPLVCSNYDVSRDAFAVADGAFTAVVCQRCLPPCPENGWGEKGKLIVNRVLAREEKEKLVVNRPMQMKGEVVTVVRATSKETLAAKTEHGLSTVTVSFRPPRTITRRLEASFFPSTLPSGV